VRHRLEYLAVGFVRQVVRFLPWRVTRALGAALGRAFHALDPSHRRLAVENLQRAFPLRSRRECRAIARATFVHFGRLLVDLLKFSTLAPEWMTARVDFEGLDRMHQLHERGRGVLLFTAHFGYWEQAALVHALGLAPMAVVARPLDNPRLHALLESVRTGTGNIVIYRRGGLRRIMRALSANMAVAMLIDQHIQEADAVYVDFFNRPAATTSALAALALRTGAPVVPVFALPLPDGRFRLVYEHPVEPPREDHPDPIHEFTQRCTDVLEMYVRRYPEFWLWMHRRWRDVDDARLPARGMFPAATPDRNGGRGER